MTPAPTPRVPAGRLAGARQAGARDLIAGASGTRPLLPSLLTMAARSYLPGSRAGRPAHRRVHKDQPGEVRRLAGKQEKYIIQVTHRYVPDPAAVERGLQIWAMYLAEHLRSQALQPRRKRKQGTAQM